MVYIFMGILLTGIQGMRVGLCVHISFSIPRINIFSIYYSFVLSTYSQIRCRIAFTEGIMCDCVIHGH